MVERGAARTVLDGLAHDVTQALLRARRGGPRAASRPGFDAPDALAGCCSSRTT